MRTDRSTVVLLFGAFAVVIATVLFLLASSLNVGETLTGAATFTISQEVAVDITGPSVTIQSIEAGTPSQGKLPVTVRFVVGDASEIQTCSLLIDGAVVDRKTEVPKNEQLFFVTNQPPGDYAGEVHCVDALNNAGSHSFTMTITPEDVAEPSQLQTAVCGNGVVETGEQCDTGDFGSLSCRDFGSDSGVLLCKSDCTADISNCISAAAVNDETSSGNGTAGLLDVVTAPTTRTSGFAVFGISLAIFLALVATAVGILMVKRTPKPKAEGMQQHIQQLADYIRYATVSGMQKEQIVQELMMKKWPPEIISEAFRRAGLS